MNHSQIERFELRTGWTTQAGRPYPKGTFLAYKTFGKKENQIVIYPTYYSGSISNNEWLIGTQRESLNPDKYYIIVPALFGNGQSSSPSHYAGEEPCPFPQTTMYDNVRAQHALLAHLGVANRKVFVTGFSMGAAQAFAWAVAYPEIVQKIAPICGAARCAEHNQTFLYSLKKTLELDPEYRGGAHSGKVDDVREGKIAFASIYSSWGLSQAFYRAKLYKQLGFETLDDFVKGFWEETFVPKDAHNLVFMLNTWSTADITTTPGHSWSHDPKNGRSSDEAYEQALASIQAEALVLPCKTDLYFPPEDSEFEVGCIGSRARLDVIPSIWGHMSGGGANSADIEYIDHAIATFFGSKALL